MGAAGADETSVRTFPWVAHGADTIYVYRVTAINGGGVENSSDEVVAETAPAFGSVEFRVASLSISARPVDDLLTEVSYLRIEELSPVPQIEDAVTAGFSLDLRWEGWATIDPMLHIETVENDPRGIESATLWQTYLSVRVVK